MPENVSVVPFVLTYYINHQKGGYSERHFLSAADYGEAVLKAKDVCLWRMAIASAESVMVHSRVGLYGNPRDRKKVIEGELPALKQQDAQENPINLHDRDSCVNYTFETALGKWNTRQIRGVPDAWIENETIKATKVPIVPIAVLPAREVATEDIQLFGGLLKILKETTFHAKPDPANAGKFFLTQWDKVILTGVSTRKTGRPFGMRRGRARTHS